ncbi:hypothetical protein KP509_07G090100 [Ceratopteris richardii]|uniref:Reverse transcriptase zinc-binding domain-containing protein n=1 Tax=Ceratopteris richardii TaxID=49495 RepID=A0A8T2UHB6_CERRI|nr:hypothetical protein KP509_07G090100 [Ceratopteris richardii]
MASTPMFYLLQAKMESGFIHGISLHGIQHIVVGFVDDTFFFAKVREENIQHILDSLTPFSQASSLITNMGNSGLINISARHLHFPSWQGRKIECGIIFRHLGYPLGINVSTKDQIQWVLCKIKSKLNLWHAAQWPLHIRIRIVKSFLEPYIMYYILLLDWKKCHLYAFDCLIKNFLWNKAHNRALVSSSWDFICEPKSKEGLGILHLHSHMMARRITSFYKPLWTNVFWKLNIWNKFNYKGSWKLNIWNKFFSHAPLQTSSATLSMLRYLGNSFASMSPYSSFLANPPLAYSLGAAARYFNNKGIDSIAKCYDSKWEFLSFPVVRRVYAVGPAYRSKWIQLVLFLQQFQFPLLIDESLPRRDWLFAKHTRWWNGIARTYYLSLVDDITSKCNLRWKMDKTRACWHARFSTIWDSSLTFKMKVFMWRISVGHFTLGAFLSKHGIQGFRCPHCAAYAETMCHAFWSCSHVQRWWNSLFLFPIWNSRPSKFCTTFLLFDSSNEACRWVRKRCVFFLLWTIWKLMNKMLFGNKRSILHFSWKLCKVRLRLDMDVMSAQHRQSLLCRIGSDLFRGTILGSRPKVEGNASPCFL